MVSPSGHDRTQLGLRRIAAPVAFPDGCREDRHQLLVHLNLPERHPFPCPDPTPIDGPGVTVRHGRPRPSCHAPRTPPDGAT